MAINDLVDYVVEQGEMAAEGAQIFVKNGCIPTKRWKPMVKGRNMRSVVPHYISGGKDIVLYARVKNPEKKVKVRFPEIRKEIRLPTVKSADMLRIGLRKRDLAKVEDRLTMEVVADGR
jgi:hypothetical protein